MIRHCSADLTFVHSFAREIPHVGRFSAFARLSITLHCFPHVRFARGNQFRPRAPQTARQSNLRETPNQPFRRVPLPRLHSVTIIVLKRVVIIMVTFAEGKQRHQRRVAGAAPNRVWLTANCVTG